MKATLKTRNYGLDQELTLVARDNEIIILVEDQEIASLSLETQEKDLELEGKFKAVPTKNSWLVFNPKKSNISNTAEIIVE